MSFTLSHGLVSPYFVSEVLGFEVCEPRFNTVNLLRDRGILARSLSDGINPTRSTGRLMVRRWYGRDEEVRDGVSEHVGLSLKLPHEGFGGL